MHKKLGKDDMADSQAAIRGYINFREKNAYRHKAHVLISSNGKNRFNDILYISAIIDPGNTYVVVEGNNAFAREFYGKYSFDYQRFKLIGGTLLIQATDIWGNDIEIDITGA